MYTSIVFLSFSIPLRKFGDVHRPRDYQFQSLTEIRISNLIIPDFMNMWTSATKNWVRSFGRRSSQKNVSSSAMPRWCARCSSMRESIRGIRFQRHGCSTNRTRRRINGAFCSCTSSYEWFIPVHLKLIEHYLLLIPLRDGDEWLHHRKLMNHIFLSKEIELNTQQPIETASQELIERWMKQVEAGEDVIPNLESDMYKLSIESNN